MAATPSGTATIGVTQTFVTPTAPSATVSSTATVGVTQTFVTPTATSAIISSTATITPTPHCANLSSPLLVTVGAAAMQGPSAAVIVSVIPSGTVISPQLPTLNVTLAPMPPPPYQPSGCSGAHVAVSFTFNGSGSVAITIYGDSAYRIAADEVCEAVVPLAALDSCAQSDSTATVVFTFITVIAPLPTVAATTVALSGAIVAGSVAAAVAASASAAGSMQRALTELRIAQCGGSRGEPLVLAESILQLRIGTGALSYRRGAVVGNVVFWAVAAAVAAVLLPLRGCVVLRREGDATDLLEAVAGLRLPAGLVVVYVPLLQPTLMSAVALLVESSDATDIVIGLLGVAACVAPIVWIVFLLVLRTPFGATAHATSGDAADEHVAVLYVAVCRRALAALQSERCHWRDRVHGSRFTRHYGAVFEGFVGGRQWFVLVDLSVEAVCGVLGALVDLPTQQGSGAPR